MTKSQKKTVLIIVAAVLAVLLLCLFVLAADVLGIWQGQGEATVTVKPGETDAYAVGKVLKEAGLVESPFIFKLVSDFKGVSDKFLAGTYTLDKANGYNAYMNTLTYKGSYRTVNITVPEGATLKDIQRIVVETGFVSDADFTKALSEKYAYAFLKGIERENPLEGYLFPDTYNIANTMSAREIVELMLKRFDEVYTDAYAQRAKALGYSADEMLILASVIECEAGSGNDRSMVSSVFHNRLNHPKTYPYLESCATVQYVLGEKKPILSMEDTRIDSPYNTYINKGLPVGPICNPGKAAIEAALYPAKTDYFFFQSDAQGKIYYAATVREHESLKKKIQQ